MKTQDTLKAFRAVAALVALGALTSACGTEEGAPEPPGTPGNGTTETVSGELLSNVPYLSWQTLYAKNLTAGGATLWNNKAYFAYIKSDSTIGLVIENNLGSNGQSPTVAALPNYFAAQYGVSLLVYNNWLYAFYIDLHNNMAMAYSADGVNWYGPGALTSDPFAGEWSCPPTPVVWNGGITVLGCAGSVWVLTVSGNTVTDYYWPNDFPRAATKVGAYVWNGNLYAAWADPAHSSQIYIAHTYAPKSNWNIAQVVGQYGIPSLFPDGGGALEMVYRGNDAHIYKTFTTDGVSFGPIYRDSASTTNHAPIPFENWGVNGNWVFYIGVNNGLFAVLE